MNKSMLLLVGAIAAVSAASGANAQTALYSNAPDLSGNQTGDCVYNTNCGSSITGDTYAAQAFSLAGASTVSSVGFNSIVFGDAATSVNYEILSALNGAPGSVIVSGSADLSNSAGPNGAKYATTDYSFNLGAPLALASGTYFVAFQAVTDDFDDYLSQGVATVGAFESDDGGLTFTPGYGGEGREISSVAVSVNGTSAVPEPATWAMMLMGFGMVGFGLRYSRKQSARVTFA